MKYECDLIRDVADLYDEKMLSAYARQAVEDHLASCSGCRTFYEQNAKRQAETDGKCVLPDTDHPAEHRLTAGFPSAKNESLKSITKEKADHSNKTASSLNSGSARNPQPLSAQQNRMDADNFAFLQHQLQLQRRKSILFFVLLFLCICFPIFYQLAVPRPLTMDEAIESIVYADDQSIVAFSPQTAGYQSEPLMIPDELRTSGQNSNQEEGKLISAWSSSLHQLLLSHSDYILKSSDPLYYSDDNGQIQSLKNGRPIQMVQLPRLSLSAYIRLAGVLALCSGLGWLFCRGRMRNVMRMLCLLCTSWVLSTLLIKGFHTASWNLAFDFSCILLESLLIFGLLQAFCSLRKNRVFG